MYKQKYHVTQNLLNHWALDENERKIAKYITLSRESTGRIYHIPWAELPRRLGCWFSCNGFWYSLVNPDSKLHGANVEPNWGRQDPGGPDVGPTNFVIWEFYGEGLQFNSSVLRRCGSNFRSVISEPMLSFWVPLAKLLSGECHRTPLMTSQHWFRELLGVVRQ